MVVKWDREVDVLVVGSGAGGMATAITAADKGLDVLLLEKTDAFGGSTAVSGGVVWVPENSGMIAAGQPDEPGAAFRYLRQILGNQMREDMISAYIETAPKMVDYFMAETEVKLIPRMYAPDYQSELDGASPGGRALDPLTYDGRKLGPWFGRLRRPLPQMTIFGGMMVGRIDIDHLLAVWTKLPSFIHAAKITLGYLRDRLTLPRGARLLAGNALAARLMRSALDKGVTLEENSDVRALIIEDGGVTGAVVHQNGKTLHIHARRGVVLAAGGAAASTMFRKENVPHADVHMSMTPAGNVGDGVRMAAAAGAVIEEGNVNDVFLTPVSVHTTPTGARIQFPHLILDRQKPGLIAVNSAGKRFVNEANSYHDFVEAMHRTHPDVPCIPTWLIADAAFVNKYGLGLVRPAPFPMGEYLRSGYLIKARTIEALADKIGVPAANLAETVARSNGFAREGVDHDFGKGSTGYNVYLGDADHKPNACLGPIQRPPFYAVKVFPGDIGSTKGLRTDARARVVQEDGQPIPGLYACGNDMNSIMGGHYPAGGITLGPAMTFGYIAAHDMAERTETAAEEPTA